jgi:hypothetical protein
MKLLLLFVVVSSYLLVIVDSHAKLVVPSAFNPNPSKIAACGGGATFTGPVADWPPGTTQKLTWTVVAGDGTGPIRAMVDPQGGTGRFPMSVPTAGSAPPTGLTELTLTPETTHPTAVATYRFSFVVPDIRCDPKGFCTVVVFSSTSWWACTAVNISASISNTTQPVVHKPSCQNATGLTFCTMLNGRGVSVPYQQTLSDLDQAAQDTYTANIDNPRVFSTKTTGGCASSYKYLVCATVFRRCGDSLSFCDYASGGIGCFCQETCVKASQLCGLNTTHNGLLNCFGSNIADSDTTGSCGAVTFNVNTDVGNPVDPGLSTNTANTIFISSLVAIILGAFLLF